MIAFDLKCQAAHVFEAWFSTSTDYEDQKARGLLSCPICGDVHVTKAIMAPNIGRKGNQPQQPVAAATPPEAAPAQAAPAVPSMMPAPALPKEETEKLVAAITQIRKQVEKTCDDVGKEFAEEARKIHYGEADERGIYGEATLEEAEELYEEGIDVMPLPLPIKPDQFDA